MEYFIKLVVGVKDFFNHNHTLKIRQSTSGIENEAIYIQTKIKSNIYTNKNKDKLQKYQLIRC
jgi:hypothetical protein